MKHKGLKQASHSLREWCETMTGQLDHSQAYMREVVVLRRRWRVVAAKNLTGVRPLSVSDPLGVVFTLPTRGEPSGAIWEW